MKKQRYFRAAGHILILLVAASSAAQAEEPPEQPRIGLVLSGGGALGSAHVGVLKVLEELRIPIDFVAGTSMGAIVGGLYSTGISPAEMEEILAKTNWRELLDDRPPRRHLPYREKVDDQTFLADFEAGFNRGALQMPPGLISGQKLGFALQVMAIQSLGIDDFDQLPIPFRAVATDLEEGEMVVLRGGNLPQAMRASMSLPGIFSPIKIDDRLLVDGGLVRNLPVDVARDMGANVIIAVDVGQPLPDQDELASITKVTGLVIGMQNRRNARELANQADVLIQPKLDGFGSSQFGRGSEMIPFGEAAARLVTADLERYSVSEEAYRAHLQQLRKRRSFSGAKVNSIQLTVGSTADPTFVMDQVRIRPGDPLDMESIRQDLERLYETGDYERIDFYLSQVDQDYRLYIEAIERSWGPNYLRFGLSLFADFEGRSSFDVLANYTMTKLNRRRGEFKVSAQLGENPTIVGEFYQPLSRKQTWFTALYLGQTSATEYVPVGGGAYVPYGATIREFGLDLGFQAGRWAELRLGLSAGNVTTRAQNAPDSGEPFNYPRETKSDFGVIRFTTVVDQFDNMNFPQHGYLAVIDYRDFREALGSDTDFEMLVSFLGVAFTRKRHTLMGLSNLYSALGTDSPVTQNLGGLFKLSGAPQDSIIGRYGGNISLLYLYHLFDLPMGMGRGLYVGASAEGGNLWDQKADASFDDLRYAGSIFVGMDTMFGPVYLAQGFFEGGSTAFYFYIGRTF